MEYLLKNETLWCARGSKGLGKSYLSYRKQFVNIEGCSSELLDVICGVPQGSILDPTLFIL